MAKFHHNTFCLNEGTGMICRKAGLEAPCSAEEEDAEYKSVLKALTVHVQTRIVALGLVEHWIPDEAASARCNIFISNLTVCTKLLIILQNQVGSKPGLWSRSLCLKKGLQTGSMLKAVEKAISEGYGVAILNPNANSVWFFSVQLCL